MGAGAAEVEAEETGGGAEGDAVGETDTVVFEELGGVGQMELAGVEPREVSGFDMPSADTGEGGGDEFFDVVAVGAEDIEELVAPRPTMAQGHLATGVAEGVDLGDESARGVLEGAAGGRVGNDEKRAGQAGEIESFARREHGDGFRSGEFESADVRRVVEHEVAMDFVGDEDEAVLLAEVREPRDGGLGENASDRIVRVAEDEKFCSRRDGGLERAEVDIPLAVVFHEIDGAKSHTGVFRCAEKWRIDRRAGQDFLARLDKGSAGDIERGDETGEPDDLLGGGGHPVAGLEVFEDDFDGGARRYGVTEDAVGGPLLQGGDDLRGGHEIHVRDPHGKHVASGVALPLERTGSAAVGAVGEVVSHGGSEHGTPAKQGKTDACQTVPWRKFSRRNRRDGGAGGLRDDGVRPRWTP